MESALRVSSDMRRNAWNPYLVGAGIGVLSWIAFLTASHPLGITSAYERTAAALLAPLGLAGGYLAENELALGWEWALVIGVFLGAWLSARLGRDREPLTVPTMWRARFGGSRAKRLGVAFVGGALMLFGARLADGCTSGHGVSGNLQLAASSWTFTAVFAVVSVVTGLALFRRGEDSHV